VKLHARENKDMFLTHRGQRSGFCTILWKFNCGKDFSQNQTLSLR